MKSLGRQGERCLALAFDLEDSASLLASYSKGLFRKWDIKGNNCTLQAQ